MKSTLKLSAQNEIDTIINRNNFNCLYGKVEKQDYIELINTR